MRRFVEIASLLSVMVGAGCGDNNPSGIWDALPKMWEAAPPREVVDGGNGDGGSGSDPGNIGAGSFTKMCKMVNEPWCCFDGRNVPGDPICTWRHLASGEVLEIGKAFSGNQEVPLPHPLSLRVVTPEPLTSTDACKKAPVGFILEGHGLVEEPVQTTLLYFYINTKGTWSPGDGGPWDVNVENFIVPHNLDGSSPTPDPSLPQMSLDGPFCMVRAGTRTNVVSFETMRFKMSTPTAGGKMEDLEYEANFIKGEYTRIWTGVERSF